MVLVVTHPPPIQPLATASDLTSSVSPAWMLGWPHQTFWKAARASGQGQADVPAWGGAVLPATQDILSLSPPLFHHSGKQRHCVAP
eukprot:158430-Chlamydomonas_euryale.AAC.3